MEEFVRKLKDSDIPHEVMIKEGAGHNFASIKEEAEVYAKHMSFILKYCNLTPLWSPTE